MCSCILSDFIYLDSEALCFLFDSGFVHQLEMIHVWLYEGMQTSPLPCEGREAVSDRPLAQEKHVKRRIHVKRSNNNNQKIK